MHISDGSSQHGRLLPPSETPETRRLSGFKPGLTPEGAFICNVTFCGKVGGGQGVQLEGGSVLTSYMGSFMVIQTTGRVESILLFSDIRIELLNEYLRGIQSTKLHGSLKLLWLPLPQTAPGLCMLSFRLC